LLSWKRIFTIIFRLLKTSPGLWGKKLGSRALLYFLDHICTARFFLTGLWIRIDFKQDPSLKPNPDPNRPKAKNRTSEDKFCLIKAKIKSYRYRYYLAKLCIRNVYYFLLFRYKNKKLNFFSFSSFTPWIRIQKVIESRSATLIFDQYVVPLVNLSMVRYKE
jgi:hypothetical protein